MESQEDNDNDGGASASEPQSNPVALPTTTTATTSTNDVATFAEEPSSIDETPTGNSAAASSSSASAGRLLSDPSVAVSSNSSDIHNETPSPSPTPTQQNPPPSMLPQPPSSSSSSSQAWIEVGRMVSVARRMGPGMNNPGGLGHIEKVYIARTLHSTTTTATTTTTGADGTNNDNDAASSSNMALEATTITNNATTTTTPTIITHVDVKYLPCEPRTRDVCIPTIHVSDHHHLFLEAVGGRRRATRRKREMSRRCTNCGSFATDCGDCDWRLNERMRQEEMEERAERERRAKMEFARKQQRMMERGGMEDGASGFESEYGEYGSDAGGDRTSSDDDDDDSDDERSRDGDSEEDERRHARTLRRHRKRMGKITRRRRDDDEVPLAVLQKRRERREAKAKEREREAKARERARARQLKELHRMVAKGRKTDRSPVGKGEEGGVRGRMTKRKKRGGGRTKPENACALGSLPAVGNDSGEDGGESSKEPETDAKKSGERSNEQKKNGEFEFDFDSSDDSEPTGLKGPRKQEEIVEYGVCGREQKDGDGDSSSSDEEVLLSALANGISPGDDSPTEDADADGNDHVQRPGDDTEGAADKSVHLDSDNDGYSPMGDPRRSDSAEEEEGWLTPREGYMEEDLAFRDRDADVIDIADSDGDGTDAAASQQGTVADEEVRWGNLPDFIDGLCAEVESVRVPRARNELSKLKRRRMAARRRARTSAAVEGTEDAMGELERLSEESFKLNEYIVKELHRNGVDKCNRAMERLLSKREKRLHRDELTEAQKKRCRGSAIDCLDFKVDDLNELVKDIDEKVTSFWKEVATERRSAVVGDSLTEMGDVDVDGDAFPADEEVSGTRRSEKRRTTKEKDWDHHPHASRKRKSSSTSLAAGPSSRKSLKRKRRRRGSERTAACTRGNPEINADEGKIAHSSSQTESTLENEDDLSTGSDNRMVDAAANRPSVDVEFTGEMGDFDDNPDGSVSVGSVEDVDAPAANRQSADVEFTGETDDFDDHPGGSVHNFGGGGGSSGRRTACRRGAIQQHQRANVTSRATSLGGSSSIRRAKPMTETMEGWLQKQSTSQTMDDEFETTANRRQSRLNAFVGKSNGNNKRRQSSTRGAENGMTNNGRASRHASTRPASNGRTSRPIHGIQDANPSRRGGRANSHSNSIQRQSGCDSTARSKRSTARAAIGEMALSRPAIPNALSAEALFDSLSLRSTDGNAAINEEQPMHSDSSMSLGILCQMLKDGYPTNLLSCRETLSSVTALLLSKSCDDLPKEEVVTVFRSLLTIFQRKCTTLLDLLQTHPSAALFQLDCWSLVFRMLEQKLNCVLGPEDGILYKIFGKHAILVNHILLQVMDALYSQLLWDEYGATQTFDAEAFDHFCSLCVRIGAVVPLLPTTCNLVTKMGCLKWHASLTNQQRGAELVKKYHVAGIDPLMHKQFIFSGDAMPRGKSRLKSYKNKIPRREIDAAWSIIGFVSCCCTSGTFSAPDFKQPRDLLRGIVHYDCGTLPKVDHRLPPSKLQVDACSKEIKWIHALLSSRLLGDLPCMDSFVKQLIERLVMLETFDEVIDILPSAPQGKVNKAVKQLWGYSCITGSSEELECDLHTGFVNMDTLSIDSVCCVMPSTDLLRRGISLVATYASMMMAKNPRWKGFRAILLSLASEFYKRASELEAKPENSKNSQNNLDEFAVMFASIEVATEMQIVESPTSSHLREAACHLMLAGVLARSRFNAPGEGSILYLNKDFRENIWKYSSDENMRHNQQHYFGRMLGGAPASSTNICLLFTSAKTMTFTTLLHMYTGDFKSDPLHMYERLRSHLIAVKVDDDVKMMEYSITSIISNLLATCDIVDSLNHRGRVAEQEDKCKAHLDSSKSCVDVIRSIAVWLNLIFGRAKFIMELIAKDTAPDTKLVQLAEAIKLLGSSRFFLFVVDSLTRALAVTVETANMNTFSKALSRGGCLEQAFRSCLGTIRNSIALVNACGTNDSPEIQNVQSKDDWESSAKVYLSFVRTRILSSIFDKHENGEHGKLCRNQSGGVLSVLAALCSVSQAQRVLCDVYDVFKPDTVKGDACRFYIQQMGVCFSCELTRLAQSNRNCKAIATQNANTVFKHLLVSLVDADTLAMFPTCNLSWLSHLDGHNSRSKGNDFLSKSQVYSSMALHDPDQEANEIKRMSGDYFDTAGPTFTMKNIWSFCENVGRVLIQFDDTKHSLRMWPIVRSFGKDMINITEKLRSDKELLELLPKVSSERECLKRLIMFQAIFTALKEDKDQCLDAIIGDGGGVSLVISKSIIENLYYLSGNELELEEQRNIGCVDPDTRYERAKAFTFHRSYAELCGSLMTLLLRENIHWENTAMRDIVRHGFIVSAFKRKLDIRKIIEGAAINFNLTLRSRSVKGSLNHLTRDLSLSFFRRTGELLLVCGSSCHLDNFGTMLFNSMLHAASTLPPTETVSVNTFMKAVTYRFILTPEAIGVYNPVASDGLQHAIDDRILCSEVLRNDDLHEQKSVLVFREWAMDNFLVHLLKNQELSTPMRLITLKLLTCIIETYSTDQIPTSQKIHSAGGKLASIVTYSKLFHSLKECLSNAITSNTWDAVFILELFSCARNLLALPISDGKITNESTKRKTLLSWACTSSKSTTDLDVDSEHPAYIFEFSRWLNACGKLLQNQSTTGALRDFITRVDIREGRERYTLDNAAFNNVEIRQISSSFQTLAKLEKVLSFGRAKRVHSSNPYAKNFSNALLGDKTLVSKGSLRAIEEFSNYFAGHTT